jgi:sugar phosphate isomerase/epimerase
MKAGLNLFSIRNLIATEEDFLSTAKKLKEMGYAYLQYSGAPYDVERIKRVSEETEMPICLTHVPFERIVNDTENLMDEHEKFGCKYIGLGAMPLEKLTDEKAFKEGVEALNRAGERMQKRGFKFFYHHHHFECIKFGEKTAFAYMIENAPYINFTVDTYWLQYGGMDIMATLELLKGRIACVHLKDYKIKFEEETKSFVPTFAPLGEGVLDFKKIIAKMQTLGVEYYLVEQDNAAILPDTLEQVNKSIEYLKNV